MHSRGSKQTGEQHWSSPRQQKNETRNKSKDTLRELVDNIKQNNIHIIGAPLHGEKERTRYNLNLKMAVKFPSVGKEIDN